jgi:hypothetical protein
MKRDRDPRFSSPKDPALKSLLFDRSKDLLLSITSNDRVSILKTSLKSSLR